ncbi:MAG: hypothetical protein K0R39_4452 [Symbiobacteriaceae bacterium]|jgi:hypothetical protein|nr:hypothetical protein [Symbiobacteriaceae bacterium]
MRRWLLGLLAVLVLAATAACASKEPPVPTIKAGETLIPAVLSTHCWTTRCADYPYPPDHLRSIGYQPVTVPGGATLTVTFPGNLVTPPTIHRWDGSTATPSVLVIPPESGIYTYDVGARWKQGSAAYIFQVEVK